MLKNTKTPEEAVKQLYGSRCSIIRRRSVSGGDICRASMLTLQDGRELFLKEHRADLVSMFAAEAAGLEALAEVSSKSRAPSVPRPLAWGENGGDSFLLMEAVVSGRLKDGRNFGNSLAALHRNGRSETCGFEIDNWIGATPQKNRKNESWHDFFAENRLMYQWSLARQKGYGDSRSEKQIQLLCARLPDILPNLDAGGASLLHGDLWGGNWMAGSDGRAWLIDPAVYYGHREADLAMTRLFGGFPTGFYRGYEEAWPLENGFEQRLEYYNLYHLLNHLNLFGASYWGEVRRILSRF